MISMMKISKQILGALVLSATITIASDQATAASAGVPASPLSTTLPGNDAQSSATTPACCANPLEQGPQGPVSDQSIYNLSSTWTNDAAKPFQLISLRGRPQVLTMFFAQCHSVCPILVNDLRRIEAALPEELRGRVGFVLVSFDTERDTPDALAAFRRAQKLPDHWTLLSARADDVLELAALLGAKFRKEATGQFAHSNIITLLDSEGEIALQQVGLNRDPAPVVAAVKALF